jgi:Fic family protein
MYQPITRLPENASSLSLSELEGLATVWQERKKALANDGGLQQFLKRLQREWAIETGIIERLYSWDRGVTEVLIEQGIDSTLIAHNAGLSKSDADHIRDLIEDQESIIEGLFQFVNGKMPLSEYYIRSMHAQFTTHQDTSEGRTLFGERTQIELLKGQYKVRPNNPRRLDGEMHEYCPPEFVNDEMQNLISWYQEYEDSVPPEVLAAWLHHRFTQIHPFQDGNGRIARALATLVFLKANLFPLVIRDSEKNQYYDACEAADAGNLKPLIQLFGKRQKDAILAALGIEQQVQRERYAEQIIESALGILQQRSLQLEREQSQVFDFAVQLREIAAKRFGEISIVLNTRVREFAPAGVLYGASIKEAANRDDKSHWYYDQIIQTAKKLEYYANREIYKSWIRLTILTQNQFEVVISFHGIGHTFQGILVASAFTLMRVDNEEGIKDVVGLKPATQEIFQFNYAEEFESIEQRFKDWLEYDVLAIGLAEWKRSLGG